MRGLLTDPALCGWPSNTITVIEDPVQPGRVARQIREVARETTDVLMLYYVGHGLLSARGELCLAVTDTVAADSDYTGLLFSWIKEALRESPARVKIVILDCCYAGQAIETLSQPDGIAELTQVNGTYTLTATMRNQTAHVVPLDQQEDSCTSFTGELIALTRSGVAGEPSELTLSALYPHLRRRLVALGLPQPNQRGTDTADRYVFTVNAHGKDAAESAGQADAWQERADAWYEQGDFPQAQAAYQEVIRLSPTSADAHLGLSRALRQQGSPAEAEEAVRAAVRLDPGSAVAHSGLGRVLQQQGQLDEAAAAFQEAIRLAPDWTTGHLLIGNIRLGQEQYAKAEAAYRAAIGSEPDNAFFRVCLGRTFEAAGWDTDAEAAFREAIRIDPSLASAHTGLGNALDSQGQSAEAEAAFREAVRLNPADPASHGRLAVFFDDQGKQAQAESTFREVIKLSPGDLNASYSEKQSG